MLKNEHVETYYSLQEVAEMFQKNNATIGAWLKRGLFSEAYKEGRFWKIPAVAVRELKEMEKRFGTLDVLLVDRQRELRGKVFGSLTILNVVGYREDDYHPRRLFVEVRCECGRLQEMPVYRMERWNQQYCGDECLLKVKEKRENEGYSVKEVAEMFGKDRNSVEMWLKRGVFPNAYKEGKYWRIPIIDIKELKEMEILNGSVDVNLILKQREVKGKTFGGLTILRVLGYRQEGSNQKRLSVEVGCECGVIKEIPLYNIERGRQKYCDNQCSAKSGYYIGETIYNLTITGDLGVQSRGSGRGSRYVQTVCRCGAERSVQLIKLKNGSVKSCSKDCPLYLKNMVGKKFSRLEVLKEIGRKNGNRLFMCRCDCGKEIDKEYYKLVSGHTKFCGHGCTLKRGEGSATWNSEKSWEDRIRGREYFEYIQWRKQVYLRDNFTCQCCKRRGGNMSAHHKDGYNWCIERRVDVSNGVTLCIVCHDDFHKAYNFGNNTEAQFLVWLVNKAKLLSL